MVVHKLAPMSMAIVAGKLIKPLAKAEKLITPTALLDWTMAVMTKPIKPNVHKEK